MTLKSDLIADTQRRQQRVRELRDMTQDHSERVRLDEELDRMQLTLSDLGSMDEEALRKRPAEIEARTGGQRAWPVATVMLVLAVVAGSLLLARSRSHTR
jgi:hypothetical protein